MNFTNKSYLFSSPCLLLGEFAQTEPIQLCITLGRAILRKDFTHMSSGIKVTDLREIEPWDGQSYSDDGVFGNPFHGQRHN